MNKLIVSLLIGLSCARAQGTAPTELTLPPVSVQPAVSTGITVTPSAPLVYQVAQAVRVEPRRVESRLQPGFDVGTLTFSLFSEVNTRVRVKSDDPRLVVRGEAATWLSLPAHTMQSVSAVAIEPHSGTLRVVNTEGAVIALVPYTVAPSKTVNQSVNVNYTPSSDRLGLSYSISGVATSPLDPRWNVNLSVSVDTTTKQVAGGVSVGVNW